MGSTETPNAMDKGGTAAATPSATTLTTTPAATSAQPQSQSQSQTTTTTTTTTPSSASANGNHFVYVQPHTLVRTVPYAIKLVPVDESTELSSGSEDEAENAAMYSRVEPFTRPLPVPPNSIMYRSSIASRKRTPITNAEQLAIPIVSSTYTSDKTYSTTNSVNLWEKCNGYVYEDAYNVEKKRDIIGQVLLSSAQSNENSEDHDDRSQWKSRALAAHPELEEMLERVHPLWRAISLGRLYDAGKKDVKSKVTSSEEIVLQLIMHHLQYEGLKETKNVLETESGVSYRAVDVEGSLLHGILKESIKKSDRLFDCIIADKFTPHEKQKKKVLTKEIDEQLAELGFEEEEVEEEEDINIWEEDKDKQTSIVDVDLITKKEHFQAGTLNKMVERLTPVHAIDLAYLNAFLLTYQSYTTPEKLLAKLIQRFNVPTSKSALSASATQTNITFGDMDIASKKQHIQQAVCQVLDAWIDGYYSHFNGKLLQRLLEFITNSVAKQQGLEAHAQRLKQLIDRKASSEDKMTKERQQQQLLKSPPEPQVPPNIFSQHLHIFDVGEEEIARQMTLIEFDIFKEIQPVELLNQAWSKPKLKYRAPNVLKMSDHFNNMSLWWASLIIIPESTKDRTARFTKVIKIAEKLRAINNFNGLMSMLSALSNNAVHRLRQTRDELPPAILQKQKALEDLMSNKGNSKAYRDAIRSVRSPNNASAVPCIPYLGLNLSDLTFIEEGNSDFTKSKDETMLINWDKRERISEVIMEIQRYQQVPYNYVKVHQIQDLLQQQALKLESMDVLSSISKQREI